MIDLFFLRASINFFAPYAVPAAIKNVIPPSIGIHGGGQQPGLPDGGGGGADSKTWVPKSTKNVVNMNLNIFISEYKCIKKK